MIDVQEAMLPPSVIHLYYILEDYGRSISMAISQETLRFSPLLLELPTIYC